MFFNSSCAFSTLIKNLPTRSGLAAFCRYSLLKPLGASAAGLLSVGAVTVGAGFNPPVKPPSPSGVTRLFAAPAPSAFEPANAAALFFPAFVLLIYFRHDSTFIFLFAGTMCFLTKAFRITTVDAIFVFLTPLFI